MHVANILVLSLSVLFVLGLVLFRLLWAGSQLAGFGALPKWFPAKLRRWLHGETEQRR
jgi:hypothetical protein